MLDLCHASLTRNKVAFCSDETTLTEHSKALTVYNVDLQSSYIQNEIKIAVTIGDTENQEGHCSRAVEQ